MDACAGRIRDALSIHSACVFGTSADFLAGAMNAEMQLGLRPAVTADLTRSVETTISASASLIGTALTETVRGVGGS